MGAAMSEISREAKEAARLLLGGAERTKTRVRGFAPWAPRSDTLVLLEQVRAVFAEYEDYLPLTIRQVFYRLVGKYEYEKTEQAYERLSEHLNRARRARMIPMSSVRDDGGTTLTPYCWSSAKEWLDSVRREAGELVLDRSAGQLTRLVVTCEAAGMAPQLARVADAYGIEVVSSGGFESTTDRHSFAADVADEDRPTEVLDFGDQDASGAHRFLAYMEDIEAFTRELGGEIEFTRLAVTPDQIRDLRLPTAPPKASDGRAFSGQTCQCEAIAPDVLAEILRNAINVRTDRTALNRVLALEERERRRLTRMFAKLK
jgi:hypothetical protein